MKNFLWPFFAATIVAIIGFTAIQFRPEPVKLDNFGPAPSFEMTESTGNQFSSSSLKGKVWVMSFFFTSCPKVCPTVTAQLAEISRKFAKNKNVEFVTITVDPETDTPEVLAKYAAGLKADPESWHFLNAPMEQVRAILIDGLKLGAPEDTNLHTTRFALIDARGDIRGFYQSLDRASVKELYAGITALTRG